MNNAEVNEGKTMAIIAYLTVIGFVIAIIMNSTKKNAFASFHIRQMLGLIFILITLSLLSNIIELGVAGNILNIFMIILWVFGFVAAIQGERKPVPLLGENFQEWFRNFG